MALHVFTDLALILSGAFNAYAGYTFWKVHRWAEDQWAREQAERRRITGGTDDTDDRGSR